MLKSRNVGLILSYTNTFLSMFCGLFMSSFLLRQLGDTDYGIYQTMSAFANYLVLLEFGTGTVLSRNLIASRVRGEGKLEAEKNISTVWTIMTVLSAVILAVAVAFYFLIPTIYAKTLDADQILLGKRIFVYIIVFLLSSFVSQTLNGIALAHEHYTFASALNIVKLVLRTGIIAALVLGIKQVIVISMVDAAIGVGLATFSYIYCCRAFKVRIHYRRFDKAILKASMPLCMAIFLQAIVNQSNSLVGKFVLGVMTGPEEVALYSVSLFVFGTFSSLATIPISLYVPQVTKSVLSGLEGLDLTRTLVQPCRLIVLVSGSVVFGFAACGREFVDIVYGTEYGMAWVLAMILLIPAFINQSNAVILNVLDAKNKRINASYILMVTTALNIVITILGVRRFGIIAAAAATGLATLIQVVIMNIYYQKAIGIRVMYLFRHIFKGILLYQLLGAVGGLLVGHVISNVYVAFVAAGLTYVAVAFGGYLLFGKTEEEATMIGQFLQRFKKQA